MLTYKTGISMVVLLRWGKFYPLYAKEVSLQKIKAFDLITTKKLVRQRKIHMKLLPVKNSNTENTIFILHYHSVKIKKARNKI